MPSSQLKTSPHAAERRQSQRRNLNRTAKIQAGPNGLPRDCLVTDISDGGVRVLVEGFYVPDDFVLLLSGDDIADRERAYRVVWRLGNEIGAQLVGVLRRPGA